MIAPPLLIVGLALGGGGFGLSARHIAGLAAWLVVVALLLLGAASRTTVGRPFYWGAGLLGGLALLSGLSSLWSGSIELSVNEADRVLVYLAFFLATFLLAQTDQSRQRFGEGVAIALALVALMSLGSRLLPHVLEVENSLGSGPRTRYPLGYWNANGVSFGIATAMLLWMSRRSLLPALRWLAAAALPFVLLALYLTYSRGGLVSLVVACGCLLVLSHDRLWLLATLAIGAVATLPAVLSVQSHRSLAENFDTSAVAGQGVTVLLILLAGVALAVLLFAGLRRAEARGGGLAGRAVALSRDPKVLKRVALVLALVGIGAAIAVAGRAWDQFNSSDIQFPNRPEQHFTQLSGAGRDEFWRVALDAFGEKPVLGHGAGTYVFSWNQLRHITLPVHDAHSLYLQAFAELGFVGGVLVLALVGFLLWTGFAAWRDSGGRRRELHAVLLAAMLAFAVGAAIDWLWEIAAMGAIFFLAAGVLVAARCGQLVGARAEPGSERAEQRRFGLAVAGVVVAWISAVALIGPLLVDRELRASRDAAAQGNLVSAVDHAETARSIEPWAASPYVILGLLAQEKGEYATAAGRLSQAIHREDRNWQLYYLRSQIERAAGNDAAAEADLEHARRLDPLTPRLQGSPE
ncbi:MAG TPA: O-antigen ligase family protein [Solirubrobacterales bacterium]|nr:O-antigen ligase family protein [Solirubrobacterales bacterium]